MTIHRFMKFILDTRIHEDDVATPLFDAAHLQLVDTYNDDDSADSSDAESDCYSDDSSLDNTHFEDEDDDEVLSESAALYINALFPSVDCRHGEHHATGILELRLEALIEQLSRDDERPQESSKVLDDDDSLVLTRRHRSSSRRNDKRNSPLGDSLHLAHPPPRCQAPTIAQVDDADSFWETGTEGEHEERDDDDFSEYFIALKMDA